MLTLWFYKRWVAFLTWLELKLPPPKTKMEAPGNGAGPFFEVPDRKPKLRLVKGGKDEEVPTKEAEGRVDRK
jgi:hypothetical protein